MRDDRKIDDRKMKMSMSIGCHLLVKLNIQGSIIVQAYN